jgi:hypothetical protein
VKGANPNAIKDFGADESEEAVRHVIRRTTGKCRNQNSLCWDAFGEEPCDTPNKNRGLSRASAGEDKRGAFVKPEGGLLAGI